jgi:pimeloyl-ACP methyl ester carboxylesterase
MTTNTLAEPTRANTVLFIHGLWLTGLSWEKWAEHYRQRGYNVLTPNWPGMDADIPSLNEDPSPLCSLDVLQITDYFDAMIRQMDSPPIIFGHSLGGTIMQLLLDRGLGAAGVGVAAGTVKGVPDLPLSTIWATLPVLGNPFNAGNATPLSAGQFHYAFTNTLSEEESQAVYERHHVPCANRVLFEVAFANLHRDAPTKVNFEKEDRAPMLFIAFEHDRIVPPNASRHNAEKYSGTKAVIEFHEFLGRPHFPGAPGWEAVADYAIEWAERVTKKG